MIILFKQREPEVDNQVTAAEIEHLDFNELSVEIQNQGADVDQSLLQKSSWSLSDPQSIKLFNKICSTGEPLEEYIDTDILWGVKTGLNDAFIIDASTRDEILNRDSASENFIFPLMKGDDAMRYSAGFSNRYLIRVPSGWTKSASGTDTEEDAWAWFESEYPGLANHLCDFREDAKSRYDRGECWWELRPCDYYDQFETEKIVYPEISDGPRFSLDLQGRYTNNKCFIIPRDDYDLVGILNCTCLPPANRKTA